jgi:hypothetical protein
MAVHDFRTILAVGKKVENQAMRRIFRAGPQRQFPAQQGIKQPMLAEFEFAPAGEFCRIGEIGNDPVVATSQAVGLTS